MNLKPSKKLLNEIEDVFKSMGLTPEQMKHFNGLATLARQTKQERPFAFIEAGTTSDSNGEFNNAGWE